MMKQCAWMIGAWVVFGMGCNTDPTKSLRDTGKVTAVTSERHSLSTHCPPRLGLYKKLVAEYVKATDALGSGDREPMRRFGSKAVV